ncbi:MAG: hypothetical protein M1821_003089 [Bathelium mastoideum]|nr:MAG: hypothetical protein M1821_003089 [Bathelium mastoideum]
MSARSKSPVYRVTGLLASQPDDELSATLEATIDRLSVEQESNIRERPTIVPSCYNSRDERVALVEFEGGVPSFLSKLEKDPLEDVQVDTGDTDINFDRHFHRFTQLYTPQPDAQVTADIIAITGLDGHAYGSWRGRGELGRMWLRDFVSKDMPHCRTMTYGYNSKLLVRGTDTTLDYSRGLLDELKRIRNTEEERQRPLFFIAHSFGGIILAQCLMKAARQDESDHPALASLYRATYGMLLFAIPHKGLVMKDIKQMLAGQSKHPRNELLQQISDESSYLAIHFGEFRDVIRDRKVVSFYETRQTQELQFDRARNRWVRTGDFITPVDINSALLGLPDQVEDKIPLDANHSNIVKFDHRDAIGYASALDKLKQFERDAPSIIASRFSRNLNLVLPPSLEARHMDQELHEQENIISPYLEQQKDVAQQFQRQTRQLEDRTVNRRLGMHANDKQELYDFLLKSLTFPREDARLRNVAPALRMTCGWVFDQAEYKIWSDTSKVGDHHGFLWISGKPGSGKSTLMKTIYDHAIEEHPDGTIVTYFFNARAHDSLEKSSLGMYRSLVHQLLELLPCLEDRFVRDFRMKKRDDYFEEWKTIELQCFLSHIVKSLKKRSLTIFIDALDEGEEDDVRQMVTFLEDLAQTAIDNEASLRICLSIRHYPHISIKRGVSFIVENQPGHARDIATFVSIRLKGDEEVQLKHIREKLCQKAYGVFLWVILVVQILNTLYDHGQTKAMGQRLDEIPGELNNLFSEILTKDTQNKDSFIFLLQWILFARRPLSPAELYSAVETGYKSLDELNLSIPTEATLRRYVLSYSKGLVEITKSRPPRVQFIHETVREFLLHEGGLVALDSALKDNMLGLSHDRLRQCCSRYFSRLDHNPLLDIAAREPRQNSDFMGDGKLRDNFYDGFPFAGYATRRIFEHAEAAQSAGISQRDFCKHFSKRDTQLRKWKCILKRYSHSLRESSNKYSEEDSPIYIFSLFNLVNLVAVLLENGADPNAKGKYYGNALQAACAKGHEQVVSLLINAERENSANTKSQSSSNLSLSGPSMKRQSREDFLLTHQQVDINAQGGYLGNALQAASYKNNKKTVELLLSHGANINTAGGNYGTALQAAAASHDHDIKIIELLLSHGANVNATGGLYGTALQAASYAKNKKTVELLLSYGADVNATGGLYGTALQVAAASHGKNIDLVELLLSRGAEVNAKGGQSGTALQAAVYSGHKETVDLLLSHGAEVNVKGGFRVAAMQATSREEQIEIVESLRSRGAEVHVEDA